MGIPPGLLADDEQVVVAVRPHGRVLVGPALVLLVVAPVAVVMAASVPGGAVGPALRAVILVLGGVVVLRGAVVPFLLWRSTTYTVTTHRVALRRGVLHRFGRDVALSRVSTVTFRSGPWDRLFGSGRIRIDAAGEGPLVLDDVPAVEDLQRAVRAYAERAARDDEDDADGDDDGFGGELVLDTSGVGDELDEDAEDAEDDDAADDERWPQDRYGDELTGGSADEDADEVREDRPGDGDDPDDDRDDVAGPGQGGMDDVTWRRRGRGGGWWAR